MTKWIQVVANIQGIREAFSIGSQNHQPPNLIRDKPTNFLVICLQFLKTNMSRSKFEFVFTNGILDQRPLYLCHESNQKCKDIGTLVARNCPAIEEFKTLLFFHPTL
jgi:hypothetical protein